MFAGMMPLQLTLLTFPSEQARPRVLRSACPQDLSLPPPCGQRGATHRRHKSVAPLPPRGPHTQVVIKREHDNSCYWPVPFYMAKVLFLGAVRGGQSLLTSCVIYFMAGLYPQPLGPGAMGANLAVFAATAALIANFSCMLGLSIGMLLPNAAAASGVAMPILLVQVRHSPLAYSRSARAATPQRGPGQVFFSGFYLTKDHIPVWCAGAPIAHPPNDDCPRTPRVVARPTGQRNTHAAPQGSSGPTGCRTSTTASPSC